MPEFIINVAEIEELQMISDEAELERIFTRAKSTIVQGGTVILGRKSGSGQLQRFDEITTEPDLDTYKQGVFKLL